MATQNNQTEPESFKSNESTEPLSIEFSSEESQLIGNIFQSLKMDNVNIIIKEKTLYLEQMEYSGVFFLTISKSIDTPLTREVKLDSNRKLFFRSLSKEGDTKLKWITENEIQMVKNRGSYGSQSWYQIPIKIENLDKSERSERSLYEKSVSIPLALKIYIDGWGHIAQFEKLLLDFYDLFKGPSQRLNLKIDPDLKMLLMRPKREFEPPLTETEFNYSLNDRNIETDFDDNYEYEIESNYDPQYLTQFLLYPHYEDQMKNNLKIELSSDGPIRITFQYRTLTVMLLVAPLEGGDDWDDDD